MLQVYEIEKSKCKGWEKPEGVPVRDPAGNRKNGHIQDVYLDMKELGSINKKTMEALSVVAESIGVRMILVAVPE